MEARDLDSLVSTLSARKVFESFTLYKKYFMATYICHQTNHTCIIFPFLFSLAFH